MPIESIDTQRPQLEGGLLLSILRNAGQLAGKNKLRAEDSLSSGSMDPTAAPRYKEDWWDSLYGGQANRINAAGGIDAYNRATKLKDEKDLGRFQTGQRKELRAFDTDEDKRALVEQMGAKFKDFANRLGLQSSTAIQQSKAIGDDDAARDVRKFSEMTPGVVDRSKQLGAAESAIALQHYKDMIPPQLQFAYESALNSHNAQRMNDVRQMLHSALMEQAIANGESGTLAKLKLLKETTEAGTGVKMADYAAKTLPQQQAINDIGLTTALDQATEKKLASEDSLAGSRVPLTRMFNRQIPLTTAKAAARGTPLKLGDHDSAYFMGSGDTVTQGYDMLGRKGLSATYTPTYESMQQAAANLGLGAATPSNAERQGAPVQGAPMRSTAITPTAPVAEEKPGGYRGSPLDLLLKNHSFRPTTLPTPYNYDPDWRKMNGLPPIPSTTAR